MIGGRSGVWLPCLLLLALLAVLGGCARSYRPEPLPTSTPSLGAALAPPPEAGVAAPVETLAVSATPAAVRVEAPREGEAVGSPVAIEARIADAAGRLTIAQVLSFDEEGRELRRGNGPMELGDDGYFRATLPYALDEPAEGAIEVVLVDPVSGTVAERGRVAVRLEAAPAAEGP